MAADDVVFPPLARSFHSRCFPRIKDALPLDFDADATTRDVIDRALARGGTSRGRTAWCLAREATRARACLIAVPGQSLESRLDDLDRVLRQDRRPLAAISVDGATRLLIEKGIRADLVVTDLDGLTADEVVNLHDEWHSTIVVHGHGDNLQAVEALLAKAVLDDRYLFTTQVEPTANVCNLGGFTDGDRAAFVGLALGFTRLVFVSMDLDADTIGRYSKPALASSTDGTRSLDRYPVKLRKMQVALAILRWLARELPPGCRIQTFRKRPPFEFLGDITTADELAG
ncbi:MAG: DUF115 domain-containing protein [Candidatus Lokiarchaeota archaeon]|nr:DUF115 domain-containing protein [Candidatus Lokiarchaeota archaeon]